MGDDDKRAAPGGRLLVRSKAYCDAWRKYGDVVTAFTGWHIHSFGKEIKFVSPDLTATQTMGIPFIEALVAAIKKAERQCQRKPRSSAPSSSAESPTPQSSPASQPRSFGRNTMIFDSKAASSAPENSECPSPTSSSSSFLPNPLNLPSKPPSRK